MMMGEIFCFIGIIKSSRKILSFLSGISFIVSGDDVGMHFKALHCDCDAGLVILLGIINYISVFKTEVGNKLYARYSCCKRIIPHSNKSRSVVSKPVLNYSYGYSFVLLLISFLLVEIAGTLKLCYFG